MYSGKQRRNLVKMIEQARKDISKMEKKINKIKLWLDVYETLAIGTLEVIDDEELETEEILKEIEDENPEEY